jgi:monovalent cation:H+ antiporter, CPA1 family
MSLPGTVLEVSLLLGVVVAVAVATRSRWLPLSVALVLAGFALSSTGLSGDVGRLEGEAFEQVVVLVFLPALVFAAALDLDLRAFLRNLGAVLALALVAFVASAALVGYALSWVLGIPLVVALLFGALISATDPVAVVAIFRSVGVPRRLLVLVEGESLLNDGAAIVLSSILLGAATGATAVGPAEGVARFLSVFFGGALIGAVLGGLAALVLPWLDPLPAVVMTLAVAYGGFVLAEEVLGFSGVMASAVAGLALSGSAPSRASAQVREAWEQTWGTLDYVANNMLFLLIGLFLGVSGLVEHTAAIALAVVVVLLARALAVVPVVWGLEHLAGVPRVGRRNEAVLVWGGLRGGVALALALALPESLPERDLLVALTGGVVLATLLLNATTIRALVHRLRLDRPRPSERFLAAAARLASLDAAQRRVHELGLEQVDAVLARQREAAQGELDRLDLDDDEQLRTVVGRGLQVERTTYQLLSDAGMLPPPVTRTLLREIDDEVDELALLGPRHRLGTARRAGRRQELLRRFAERLPAPAGEDRAALAYAEATARRLASRRTLEALELFAQLPAFRTQTVHRARETFQTWEDHAMSRIAALDARDDGTAHALRERQAQVLAEVEATRALRELVEAGLVPAHLVEPST